MRTSFGIEFEFDIIKSNGDVITRPYPRGRLASLNWGWQDDPTAAVELRSPIFTSIEEAAEEISGHFRFWAEYLPRCAPFAYNSQGRSLGQHIHVGRIDEYLNFSQRKNFAIAAANIYPLLAALHAQPTPSRRGLFSNYTYPIWEDDWDVPSSEHYCEISDSHHNTIEFRIFDSNIPQVTLAVAWLLTELAKVTFSGNFVATSIDKIKYRKERDIALTHGLKALDIKGHLTYVLEAVGDVELPKVQSVKEILYIAVKYRLNPYNIYAATNPNPFSYFRRMFCNADKYIDNLELKTENSVSKILRDARENANTLKTLSDLIRAVSPPEPVSRLFNLSPRSYVAKMIKSGDYSISRIGDVPYMDVYSVADRVRHLLRYHSIGPALDMAIEDIIKTPIRFYVFAITDSVSCRSEILGVIGVNVAEAEVVAAAVDRRYRRLGILRLLVDIVRDRLGRPLKLPDHLGASGGID
jgi:hypothetical protein